MLIYKNYIIKNFTKILLLLLFLVLSVLNIYAQETEVNQVETIFQIRGGHNDPPFEFIENRRPTGFNVELMEAVATVMGLKIDIQLKPWHEVRTDIEKSKIDAVTGMYYSEERAKLVDFSSPYLLITSDIFIRKESSIKSLKDLKNKKIIVEKNGLMHDYLIENNITPNIIEVSDVAKALRLLASGQYDCSLLSKMQGLYFIEKLKLSNLKSVGVNLPSIENCFAVSKGNAELLYKLNEGLHILKTTGKYKEIHDKWFGVYTKNLFWQNIKYFVYIFIFTVILMIVIISWNYLLRNQVKKHTAELRQIINLVPHMIFAKDINGRFILVNKSFAEFYDKTTEQMIGKNEIDIHPNKEEVKKFLKEDLEVIKNNEHKFIESKVTSLKTQNEHIIETTKIPFTCSHTDKSAILGISIDVTNRKKQEKIILESRRKYISIFQTAAVAIWEDDISDLKEKIKKFHSENNGSFRDYININPDLLHNILTSITMVNVNDETLKFFQARDKNELVTSLRKTITTRTLEVYKEAIIAIAEGKNIFESEVEFLTLAGKPIQALLKITIPPLYSESNSLLLSMMDITHLKEVEDEIRNLNKELEQRVQKRTLQLQETNEDLQKALKKLEEDEEAGREIQEQLLPEAKKIFQEYEFTSLLMPSLYLSGDFIDYFAIDENFLVFYMADVSGHGISSAFITILLKTYINQFLKKYQYEKDEMILHPDLVLKELNKEIIEKNLGKYLTMFYAVIDKKNEKLKFCNGGQFPFPMYIDGSNSSFLKNKNMPVGLYKSAKYKDSEIPISSTFSLLLISDGILDVISQNSLAKKEEYLLTLLKNQDCSIQSVLNDLNFINKEDLPDDITLCMLKKCF